MACLSQISVKNTLTATLTCYEPKQVSLLAGYNDTKLIQWYKIAMTHASRIDAFIYIWFVKTICDLNMGPSQLNRNLSKCEVARKKLFRGFNGIRTCGLCVRAAVLCQLSYEDPTLEAGRFIEFINPWKEWNTKWNMMWTVTCWNHDIFFCSTGSSNLNMYDIQNGMLHCSPFIDGQLDICW